MNGNYSLDLLNSHIERDFSNDAKETEKLLEAIEEEFKNPDDMDWSIEAITEYAKRQYDSNKPDEAKINDLFAKWLNRVKDTPEEIEKRKQNEKRLIDIVKKEFDNCNESNYVSEISQILGNKIDIKTKDKDFIAEVDKIIKEAIKEALRQDGRFESEYYILAKHGILSMDYDVSMLEAGEKGFLLTCPEGGDYFDYVEPTITYKELAKKIFEKIRGKYPTEVQINFNDVEDIIEDMHEESEKNRYSSYRGLSSENDFECFIPYESAKNTEQTKMVITGLMEKYKNEPRVLKHLKMVLSKVSNYDEEIVKNISFTLKKEDVDKYIYDVLAYYLSTVNIDLANLSSECYEEDAASYEGCFNSSDFISILPRDFIEKMDMAYDQYDPEGKPNRYADTLAEIIAKYCRDSKGNQFKAEDIKRSLARGYMRRSAKALSRLSKELEADNQSGFRI